MRPAARRSSTLSLIQLLPILERADTASSRCVDVSARSSPSRPSHLDLLSQAFSVVWIEIRGFSQQSFGLTYIALGLGFLIGAMAIALLGGEHLLLARTDLFF